MRNVLTLILAGGKGTRLDPLTRDRAKPAVPFGGLYRIIDFTLSNCINSNLRQVLVLTQYKARSLDRHIHAGWGFLSRELNEYVEVLPPQQRIDEHWYKGTADAIYQNIYSIEKADPSLRAHPGGRPHLQDGLRGHDPIAHRARSRSDHRLHPRAAARGRPISASCRSIDEDRIVRFLEKPQDPIPLPDSPHHCLASMGIYVFTARPMYELLCQDATHADSDHDFGKNIIPGIIDTHHVFAFRFRDKNRKAVPYWRDVGTLDAYYQANMDLVEVDPVLNLYDHEWPIRTCQPQLPPPKFVFCDEGRTWQCPPRRSSRQHGVPGLHHQWRPRAPQHPVAQCPRQQFRPGRELDSVPGSRCRPSLPHPPGHHRQGRGDPARTRPSATTSITIASAVSRSLNRESWSLPRRSCRRLSYNRIGRENQACPCLSPLPSDVLMLPLSFACQPQAFSDPGGLIIPQRNTGGLGVIQHQVEAAEVVDSLEARFQIESDVGIAGQEWYRDGRQRMVEADRPHLDHGSLFGAADENVVRTRRQHVFHRQAAASRADRFRPGGQSCGADGAVCRDTPPGPVPACSTGTESQWS